MSGQSQPKVGTIWQHYNGQQYLVLMIANEMSTNPDKYPPSVVYQNVVTLTVWCRPVSDWARSLTPVELAAAHTGVYVRESDHTLSRKK